MRAKARLRLQRFSVPAAELPHGDAVKIRAGSPTWRIQITRWDGQRVQITAHAVFGKLLHGDKLETGKQLGRRIGVLLQEGALC